MVLLLSLGLDPGAVSQEDLKEIYVCSINEDTNYFLGGLSESSYTGYPSQESKTDAKQCREGAERGVWIPILEYMENNGVSASELISLLGTDESTMIQYICYPNDGGCEELI